MFGAPVLLALILGHSFQAEFCSDFWVLFYIFDMQEMNRVLIIVIDSDRGKTERLKNRLDIARGKKPAEVFVFFPGHFFFFLVESSDLRVFSPKERLAFQFSIMS
jgi:hypothetical protein